jgi:small subunit ribosomal protein S8
LVNNLFSDSVTRLRNGFSSNLESVYLLKSNFIISFLNILLKEGYIRSYSLRNLDKIKVFFKYYPDGSSVIRGISIISKPGRKFYCSSNSLWKLNSQNKGTFILSTNKGLMTSRKAQTQNLGGEVLIFLS